MNKEYLIEANALVNSIEDEMEIYLDEAGLTDTNINRAAVYYSLIPVVKDESTLDEPMQDLVIMLLEQKYKSELSTFVKDFVRDLIKN